MFQIRTLHQLESPAKSRPQIIELETTKDLGVSWNVARITFLNFVIWFSLFQKLNCVIQRWRHTILYRRKNLTRSPPTALAQVTVVFLFENFDARHLLSTSISRWFSTKKFFTFFYNVPPYSSSFLYIKVSVQMLISLPHLQSNYLIQQFVVL